MRRVIDYTLCFALVLCLFSFRPASAQDITLGSGLICDTAAQVERYFAILEKDAEVAVEQVNAEVGKSNACGLAYLAFHKGRIVSEGRAASGPYKVVEILVIAVFDGREWHRVPPLKQYTAVAGAQERGA